MLELIAKINGTVNNFIWGIPAMICIIGVGVFLSCRTRFRYRFNCSCLFRYSADLLLFTENGFLFLQLLLCAALLFLQSLAGAGL